MKKLINSPENVVVEALRGMEAANSDLIRVHYDPIYVARADVPIKGKVALVSGGGSGHEPMHGGFVGMGMLDAAAPGAIFTSPTPDQMLEATKAVDGGAGILHIVKNYTGDVMNFDMAAELACSEDIQVEAIVTNDDVAVQDSLYTAGRRGVGVTVLLEKIAGAAAERGQSLAQVLAVANKVNENGRSMGMALTSCIVPHVGNRPLTCQTMKWKLGLAFMANPGARASACTRARHCRNAGECDCARPAVQIGRRGARFRQWIGRHATHRTVYSVQRVE